MAATPRSDDIEPWYRQRWPWILIGGPALVVVASIATAVIAVRTDDGVVAEDYYKQGLEINRTLDREHRAAELGVTASLQFNEEATRVRVVLGMGEAQPRVLRLKLVHPTRAGEDQSVVLAPVVPNIFEGKLAPPQPGNWMVQLEDGAGTWRIDGEWHTGAPGATLGAVK
jgi:hypothetical protein